ncbi:MAG: hypothetical protein ACOVOV_00405 [Dolichospermum sp.]
MAQSSPEGIILGKGSQLESLKLSINKETVLEIKKDQTKDEFAIGFAEFLYDCALNETLDNKSLKELLEIYKEEKGL